MANGASGVVGDVAACPLDLALIGGTVETIGSPHRIVEAVGVRGSRIAIVGSSREILAAAGAATRVVDLRGRSVIPGLIDNHIHMANAWQRHWVDCSYPKCRTIDDIAEVLAAEASARPADTWVIGRGFEPARLREGRSPSRLDLDPVLPDHRIGICNREGMGWTFNTRGLRAIGVNDDTHDPPGGRLERDSRGAPLGPMWDNARTAFIVPNTPRPTDEDIVGGYAWIEQELLAHGITTAHEAGYKEARHARAWSVLRQRQEPGVRIVLGPYPLVSESWDEQGAPGSLFSSGLSTGYGDDWLTLGSLQLGVDGGLIGATAALFEPYSHRTDMFRGTFRVDQSTLNTAVLRADEAGWCTGLICQGDAGIERALNAISGLGAARRQRHRLEHAYQWTPALMDQMAMLDVVWNTQPSVLPLTGPYLGTMFGDRARFAFPFRSMLDRGVTVSGGSDWGVGSINPFVGMDALVNHRSDVSPAAPPLNPSERVSLTDAIRIYTLGGAKAGGQDADRGSIEVGKLADLVVLNLDVTTLAAERVTELEAMQTYVGGRLAFERAPTGTT